MQNNTKHKVFISYYHKNDQKSKEKLLELNEKYEIFIDKSVDTGGIREDLPDDKIRTKIRDEYLKDSTVTILLVGTETKNRKHVDWELYSSMYNGAVNKQSGILCIHLPGTFNEQDNGIFEHPDTNHRNHVSSKEEAKGRYPYMPERIIDNIIHPAKVFVANWEQINNPTLLSNLIERAHSVKEKYEYDLSREMRKANS